METKSKWIALALTVLVLPGMGHWYLRNKWRGLGWMILALLILLGGIARFMSVMFAVANVQGVGRPPNLKPWDLVFKTWQLDASILLTFIAALLLTWILATLDLLLLIKRMDHR